MSLLRPRFAFPAFAAAAMLLSTIAPMLPGARAVGAPAAAVTTGPTIDLSSPKSAAKSLFKAVAAGDAAGVRQILLTDDEQQEQLAGALADVLTAGKRLNDAARDKFGAAGDSIGKPTITETDAARIDAATLTPMGNAGADEVSMQLPGIFKPMIWRKLGDQWRLRVMDYAGAKPDQIPEQVAVLTSISQAMSDTADDINSGKLSNSNDAESSLQQRMNEVMIRAARAARGAATTQSSPATTPTSAPTNQ